MVGDKRSHSDRAQPYARLVATSALHGKGKAAAPSALPLNPLLLPDQLLNHSSRSHTIFSVF